MKFRTFPKDTPRLWLINVRLLLHPAVSVFYNSPHPSSTDSFKAWNSATKTYKRIIVQIWYIQKVKTLKYYFCSVEVIWERVQAVSRDLRPARVLHRTVVGLSWRQLRDERQALLQNAPGQRHCPGILLQRPVSHPGASLLEAFWTRYAQHAAIEDISCWFGKSQFEALLLSWLISARSVRKVHLRVCI